MREIKLRAWDEKNSKMLYEFTDDIYRPSMDYGELVVGGGGAITDYYELELMEYTGLHDRNGKEIYESDIVVNEAKVIYKVCFGFCWKLGYTGWYAEGINIDWYAPINNDADSDRNSLIEVIGNIFENADILNKPDNDPDAPYWLQPVGNF